MFTRSEQFTLATVATLVNAGQAYWQNEIASGVLRAEVEQGLDDWQDFSDTIRPIIWSVVGPILVAAGLLIAYAALALAKAAVWSYVHIGIALGYWLEQAREFHGWQRMFRPVYIARSIGSAVSGLVSKSRQVGQATAAAIGWALCVTW
jgi:hypothetical protein